MKNRELIEQVAWKIQDSSYSHPMILARINKGVRRIAGMIDLPDLKSSDTVVTNTNPYVDLPSSAGNIFHRKEKSLFFVASQGQDQELNIMDSWIKFLAKYPRLDETGDVTDVCVRGGRLYYQPIPTSTETLDLHFFRRPVDMVSESNDEPDGIPDHLQEDLLVYFACWDIFKEIEEGEGKTPDTDKYHSLFAGAVAELQRFVGLPDARATHYESDPEDFI